MRLPCLVACVLALPAAFADTCAVPADSEGLGVGVYVDQDLFVPGTNRDRDYTMGVGVEVYHDRGPLTVYRDLLAALEPLVGFDRACGRLYQSYLAGAVTYTPDDIGNPAPILDDRPYASLLYLSNKKVVADADRVLGVEVMLGAIGLNVARNVQTALHGWVRDQFETDRPVDPEGWEHQISNGGEPTLRLRVASGRLLAQGSGWDVARSWEANLGFQTNAAIGLTGRVGAQRGPFWSTPHDPVNRGSFVPSPQHTQLYAWAAGRLRAVAYDALLQGQFRDSRVTVDDGDMRRLVWEGAVGITRGWPGWQLTFAVNAKAGDTRLPQAPDEHVWGGVYLSWWHD
ncbi:MAG: lipid A deacylase LpxR family protein [Chromatiaceae bacterium]|nr:lipid A deacylase LpxR family protein [Gammaproteobacteria bacterium]MCP5300396.1 lipid A deacylase LpxR family protein [Chromatiaceae bacterium]MCP5422468.1 lipid A deacylase LpxR family protein [Chromatiaceae bacterium]